MHECVPPVPPPTRSKAHLTPFLQVWDMRTKAQVHVLAGHTATISDVKCQESDPQVITGSMDSTIRSVPSPSPSLPSLPPIPFTHPTHDTQAMGPCRGQDDDDAHAPPQVRAVPHDSPDRVLVRVGLLGREQHQEVGVPQGDLCAQLLGPRCHHQHDQRQP